METARYGTYGLVTISKKKPSWLIKTIAVIIVSAVIAAFLIYRYY